MWAVIYRSRRVTLSENHWFLSMSFSKESFWIPWRVYDSQNCLEGFSLNASCATHGILNMKTFLFYRWWRGMKRTGALASGRATVAPRNIFGMNRIRFFHQKNSIEWQVYVEEKKKLCVGPLTLKTRAFYPTTSCLSDQLGLIRDIDRLWHCWGGHQEPDSRMASLLNLQIYQELPSVAHAPLVYNTYRPMFVQWSRGLG